ncbi:hypothetical protein KMP13_04690 [Epibacterium ulvae]|uniref:hypothetical protein n=1 Tax=Epibacterium ulvae TaxID=1156985 RepID=UPI001BFC202A|nr:hypothetical protein [Epibacterium ulvae]MBT8153196.1 hypothetical protein [Epibacterium ulvae]
MATLTTTHTGLNITAVFKPFVALGKFLVQLGESNARVQVMRKLMEMSDEELAKRGLKREDIVQHVFADKFYI